MARSVDDRSTQRSSTAVGTSSTVTRAGAGDDVAGKRKTLGRRSQAAAARLNRPPSLEALAMAGYQCIPAADEEEEEGVPPEHLRALDAFLEEVVPAEMVVASQREETARLRRNGESRRSRDDDMKEKLRLWAKAVAMTSVGRS